MGDFYDESGYTAPQLGMPTRHERILAQSGMDAVWKFIVLCLDTPSKRAATIALIGILSTGAVILYEP